MLMHNARVHSNPTGNGNTMHVIKGQATGNRPASLGPRANTWLTNPHGQQPGRLRGQVCSCMEQRTEGAPSAKGMKMCHPQHIRGSTDSSWRLQTNTRDGHLTSADSAQLGIGSPSKMQRLMKPGRDSKCSLGATHLTRATPNNTNKQADTEPLLRAGHT